VTDVGTASTSGTPTLRRALGRWDLTAIGVNQVIGGAVFALPAALAAASGRWSALLIVAVGIATLMIALTFAEVSSRFDTTGGPYLYTRAAFGRFAAFEVGWMQWFSRVASWASVINVLVASLGFYWPAVTVGAPRTILLTSLIAALMAINIIGIRQSAAFVNAVTIGKLLPLVIVIAVGLLSIDIAQAIPDSRFEFSKISSTALLLVFAFGGYEVVPVVAGEAKNPRREIPFALIATILLVMPLLAITQVITMSTLADVSASRTPLADAAARLMGAGGAALITVGALFSTTGNNMGQALSGSRNLFALAEQGDLPPFFGRYDRPFLRWLEDFSLPEYELRREDGQFVLEFPGRWVETTMWEIPALGIINELRSRAALRNYGPFTLDVTYARAKAKMWEKVERLKKLNGLRISDFGTRRRHSFLWQRWCVEALKEGLGQSFTGTSNFFPSLSITKPKRATSLCA